VRQNSTTISSPSFKGLHAASSASSRTKRANKGRDTTHELLLRREIWHLGLRYRKHAKDLPGKPDIIFPGARVAVFCDGDFWHGRSWSRLRRKLRNGSNANYWIEKIASNMKRDEATTKTLTDLGWHVIRVWEADIKKDPRDIANVITLCVKERAQCPRGIHHKADQ
jgi:DNA mismatch endonuclease, patch repair protein